MSVPSELLLPEVSPQTPGWNPQGCFPEPTFCRLVSLTNFRGLSLFFCASWQISPERKMSKALLVSILKPIQILFSVFN